MSLGIAITVNGQTAADLAEAGTVEIHERIGEATGYRLDFAIDIGGGDLPLLVDEHLAPGSVLAILVPMDSGTECLVQGPVHAHEIHLQHGGAGSTLTVTGADSSIIMDRETRTAQWVDVTDADAVSSILGTYDYALDVAATDAGHYEEKHTLVQRDSDLRFVRRLARRNGCHFWVTSDAHGNGTAHFKQPDLDGATTAELVIDLESPTIETLDITWDVERPTSAIGSQLDLTNKEVLDGVVAATPQTILGVNGLGAIAGDTRSVHLLAPADDVGDLQARGQGLLIESDWFIRAQCRTSLHRLGTLVRAHSVVEVRGAGSRYSGRYFVAAVHHTIDAVAHHMDITLLRNGWNGSGWRGI